MSRHDLDLTSLIAGLVFVLIGGLYLLDASGTVELEVKWVVPLALIGLGTAGLAGSLLRVVKDRPVPAEDRTGPGGDPADVDL